jgi:hypothetical protein
MMNKVYHEYGGPRMTLMVPSERQKTRLVLQVRIRIKGVVLTDSLQTLRLVPLYSSISPVDPSLEYSLPSEASDALTSTEEFDFPSTLIVFTERTTLDLTNKFRRDADAYYVEAKRSTVLSIAQIPYWMYGVLVVLGWNEAMAVLFNPLYFTFLLIASAAA